MKIKKILKTVFLCLLFCFAFCVSAFAADNDYYSQQYQNSGIPSLEEHLSEQAKELLEQMDIDPSDPDFADNITAQNIFSHIFTFLKSGLKNFKWAFVSLLFICILSAAASLFCDNGIGQNTVNYTSVLCICTIVLVPLFSHINTVINAIKAGSVFMLSFIPVYSSCLLLGSAKLSTVGSSATLLFAAEAVSMLSSFVILPLLSGYLAIGICSSVSTMPTAAKICSSIKKVMLWVMSLAFTVFLGIIGIQTTISSAADSLGTKTAKFMISSSVPMVGSALSESLGTVLASIKLLRSSAAVYAIIALAAVFLPPLIETLLWQLVIKVSEWVAEMFSQEKAGKVLGPISDALSLVSGIILFIFALFVISLSVINIITGGSSV